MTESGYDTSRDRRDPTGSGYALGVLVVMLGVFAVGLICGGAIGFILGKVA